MSDLQSNPEFKHRFVITNPERVVVPKEVSEEKKQQCIKRRSIEEHHERLRLKAEAKEIWE